MSLSICLLRAVVCELVSFKLVASIKIVNDRKVATLEMKVESFLFGFGFYVKRHKQRNIPFNKSDFFSGFLAFWTLWPLRATAQVAPSCEHKWRPLARDPTRQSTGPDTLPVKSEPSWSAERSGSR